MAPVPEPTPACPPHHPAFTQVALEPSLPAVQHWWLWGLWAPQGTVLLAQATPAAHQAPGPCQGS